jgi:inner membrane transporter RhtA
MVLVNEGQHQYPPLVAVLLAFAIDPSQLSLAQFPAAGGLAVLTPLIPFFLEMRALRRMDIGAFSILMSLEPAFVAVFGYLILGQILSAQQGIGNLAVMVASIGAVYFTSSKKPAMSDLTISQRSTVVMYND